MKTLDAYNKIVNSRKRYAIFLKGGRLLASEVVLWRLDTEDQWRAAVSVASDNDHLFLGHATGTIRKRGYEYFLKRIIEAQNQRRQVLQHGGFTHA